MQICPQRQKLLECSEHALVLGGPGSGKTTLALKKAIIKINNGLEPGQSVLFLSFSRSAVARIEEAAMTEVPKQLRYQLSLQTFHSFFWGILSSHSYLLGAPKKLEILLPQDEKVCYGSIKSRERNNGNSEWLSWLDKREKLFMQDGKIAFDLFFKTTEILLAKSSHIKRLVNQKYPLIIVDEAQDTDEHAWRCIKLLSLNSQIICLADLDQQIFDYLPGIGPERINSIKQSLTPLEIDLAGQNYRSEGTEISIFGQDILTGNPRGSKYKGVSLFSYNPKVSPKTTLRTSIILLKKEIKKATGNYSNNIAILTHSAASAAKISAALNIEPKPIRHKLVIDEAQVLLTARFVAFLLEPKDPSSHNEDLAIGLELLANVKASDGHAAATKWRLWANKIREGKNIKAHFVEIISSVIHQVRLCKFTGDPSKDWSLVKYFLRNSRNNELITAAKNLDYLVAFNRGRLINNSLSETWTVGCRYENARKALDAALAYDLILGGFDDPPGIQVMTIHKSKGKQFDGVILIREGRHDGTKMVSSFVWWDDQPPFIRSRKILRVGITRAKVHTLISAQIYPSCPIMKGHVL